MEEDQFVERTSLKIRNSNLNYTHGCNNLVCLPNDDCLIATNGAVLVRSLGKAGKSKQEQVFSEHKKTVMRATSYSRDRYCCINILSLLSPLLFYVLAEISTSSDRAADLGGAGGSWMGEEVMEEQERSEE